MNQLTHIDKVVADINQSLKNNPSMNALAQLKQTLLKAPLNQRQLTIFFSTLWPFFQATPKGIISLTLRLADQWGSVDPFQANTIAAHILFEGVDEFGLGNVRKGMQQTHNQLFKNCCDYFKVGATDILSSEYTLNSAKKMAKISYEYYRNQPVAVSLGFHLASEFTSWPEFCTFLAGFMQHKDHYGIDSEQHPAMKIFYVHTLLEPEHLAQSEDTIRKYLTQFPEAEQEIRLGIEVYMKAYFELFDSLNKELLNTHASSDTKETACINH